MIYIYIFKNKIYGEWLIRDAHEYRISRILSGPSQRQRAKTTDSRINPGRVRHEARLSNETRRGINNVTQNSRRTSFGRTQISSEFHEVGNLMAETFELSDASKSPRFVIYISASIPPSSRIVGNVYPIFITLFYGIKCVRLSLESEDISSAWISTPLRSEYLISSYYLDTVENSVYLNSIYWSEIFVNARLAELLLFGFTYLHATSYYMYGRKIVGNEENRWAIMYVLYYEL